MEQLSSFAKSFKNTEAAGYLKGLTTKVKQMALNLTDLEVKVEEATNAEPWGPHGSAMAEISEAAYDSEGYRQIMGVIARRLQDTGELWRHVYKSLLLLEYMLKHGPQRVVQELSSNVVVIEKLQNFQYKDKNLRDHGENVRHRAKLLADLILDPERVREERKKAKELKSKYTGVSSDTMRARTGRTSKGSGFGTSSFDDDDEDDIYATRASSSSGGSTVDKGAVGRSSRQTADDPIEATRARIEAIRAREQKEKEAEGEETPVKQSKKLSSFQVDPKLSASLGLKAPKPTAAAAKPAASAGTPASQEIDLMGGFDDARPAVNPSKQLEAVGPKAAGGDTWNAFEDASDSGAANTAAKADTNGDADWANFEGASGQAQEQPKSADPVADLFALDSHAAPAEPVKAATPPAPADPFGFDAAPARPAAAAPEVPKASAAPASKPALPEDFFSERPSPVAASPQAAFHPAAVPYGVPPQQAAQHMQQPGGYGMPGQQVPYGQPQVQPYGQPQGAQPGFAAFGITPQASNASQLSGGGTLPAGFAGGSQGPASLQQQGINDGGMPQGASMHMGSLGLTGQASPQSMPSGKADPFAGLGF